MKTLENENSPQSPVKSHSDQFSDCESISSTESFFDQLEKLDEISNSSGVFSSDSESSNGHTKWLRVKNLTYKIDTEILKTIFGQHGSFDHYYYDFKKRFAICKFNSIEETVRAQENLQEFKIFDTVISAEILCEEEIDCLLKYVGIKSLTESCEIFNKPYSEIIYRSHY